MNKETCAVCGKPFTDQEWRDRHDTYEGKDCHEECCPQCFDYKKVKREHFYKEELPAMLFEAFLSIATLIATWLVYTNTQSEWLAGAAFCILWAMIGKYIVERH